MSKKTELLQAIQGFKSFYEALEKEIKGKRQSGLYTSIGLESEIKRLLANASSSILAANEKMNQIIDSGLKRLEDTWKGTTAGKLCDGGYQAGLSNVLKMLEMGVVTEQRDIQAIIDVYREDYNALAAIRAILLQSTQEAVKYFASLVPKDMREDNRRLLGQLKNNVDSYVNAYAVEMAVMGQVEGFSSISLGLDGISTFINDRLGDDLELHEWNN